MTNDKPFCKEHSRIEALVNDLVAACRECQQTTTELRERCARQDEASKPLHNSLSDLTQAFRDFNAKLDHLETKLDRFEGGLTMLRNLTMAMLSAGGISLIVILGKAIEHIK